MMHLLVSLYHPLSHTHIHTRTTHVLIMGSKGTWQPRKFPDWTTKLLTITHSCCVIFDRKKENFRIRLNGAALAGQLLLHARTKAASIHSISIYKSRVFWVQSGLQKITHFQYF